MSASPTIRIRANAHSEHTHGPTSSRKPSAAAPRSRARRIERIRASEITVGGGLRRGCQRRVKIAPVSTAKRGDADHSGEGFLLELRSRVERLSGDHLDSQPIAWLLHPSRGRRADAEMSLGDSAHPSIAVGKCPHRDRAHRHGCPDAEVPPMSRCRSVTDVPRHRRVERIPARDTPIHQTAQLPCYAV